MFCNRKLKNENEQLKISNEQLKISNERLEKDNNELRKSLKLSKRIDEKQAKKDFCCLAFIYGGIFVPALIVVYAEYQNTHKPPLSLIILALLATGGLEPYFKGVLMGDKFEKYHYSNEEYQMFFEQKINIYKFACIGAIILVYSIIIGLNLYFQINGKHFSGCLPC